MALANALFGARLKLARANHHIGDLETLLDGFIADNPHRTIIEEDDEHGGVKIDVVFDRPLHDETAAIIGDAVHNLRASLDHLACDMIRASGKEPNKWHGFPIYERKADFNGGITSKLKGADDKFLRFAEDQRPYRDEGGNAWFHDLSTLDNDDKHILLLPTISVWEIHNLRIMTANGSPIFSIGHLRIGGDSNKMNLVSGLPKGSKFETDGDETLEVLFDKGPLRLWPIKIVLNALSKGVADTIRDAKPLF